jgi:hypothetical protein
MPALAKSQLEALHVLSVIGGPASEYGIYVTGKRLGYARMSWHSQCRALVDRGFAVRSGARGGYCWEISIAGAIFYADTSSHAEPVAPVGGADPNPSKAPDSVPKDTL